MFTSIFYVTCVFFRVEAGPGSFSLTASVACCPVFEKECCACQQASITMALDTGMKCVKYLLFIFNLLFVVSVDFLRSARGT